MTRALATFGVLTALTLGAGGCLPDPEEGPTWSGEIRPMLIAHCGRCHDGNYWNEGNDTSGKKMSNYLTETPTDFSVITALARVNPPNSMTGIMPPPPAEPLKDWQIEMLQEWANYPKP